jgi:putative hydrolase of the HAD superfamily
MAQLKAKHGFKIAMVSNEGRELNTHRVRKFGLNALADVFVSSSFVHCRKPDARIYRLALDIAQTSAEQVVYIEDTAMFVRIAENIGIRSILHTDHRSTRKKLTALGLGPDEGAIHHGG